LTESWHASPDKLSTVVKLHPTNRCSGLYDVGANGPGLRVSVTGAAEESRANPATRTMPANALALAACAMRVVAGATSRQKLLLRINGDPAAPGILLDTL